MILETTVWLTNETEPQLVEVNGVVTIYPNPMARPTEIPKRAGDKETLHRMIITLERIEK